MVLKRAFCSSSSEAYKPTLWTNLIWDLTKYHRIAFEVTRRETEYKEPTNLPSKDFGFQTQFQWTF